MSVGEPDFNTPEPIKEAAKKLPERGPPQDGEGRQGEAPPQPGDGDASSPQSGERGAGTPAPADGKTQRPPADPQAQAQADAAQRQRMQEALDARQGEPPGDAAQGQAAAETPEQRERRLANDAWLKRVPDDPGALLRARFRLEAQRRRGGGP